MIYCLQIKLGLYDPTYVSDSAHTAILFHVQHHEQHTPVEKQHGQWKSGFGFVPWMGQKLAFPPVVSCFQLLPFRKTPVTTDESFDLGTNAVKDKSQMFSGFLSGLNGLIDALCSLIVPRWWILLTLLIPCSANFFYYYYPVRYLNIF